MGEGAYNKQGLTRYLLGWLPETEAERFDELSVSDDEFAEALRVAENDLVDAYVQGALAGEAMEQFKSHYLASHLRREKVKFAQAFQVFAEKRTIAEAEGLESPRDEPKQKRGGRASVLSVFAPRLVWQWGAGVVAVLILITSGWLAFENVRLRQHALQAEAKREELLQRERGLERQLDAERLTNSATEQELARLRTERERLEQELEKSKAGQTIPSPALGGIVSFNLAAPLRGAGRLPLLSVPSGTRLVSIQLQLEAAEYPAYRVVLIDPARRQTLWRSSKLKAKTTREGKALSISFGAGLLNPQTVYLLRVAGIAANGADEVVSDYSFRVGR